MRRGAEKLGIKNKLLSAFRGRMFTCQEAYEEIPSVNKESVRARLYENLGIVFERVSRGIYKVIDENGMESKSGEALLLEGDGRDLSFLEDGSIQAIITDHPWSSGTKGYNRSFADYETFEYIQKDFFEKARVLGEGFLVEILPTETEDNWKYLAKIKTMAEKAGLNYYAKVPWRKGNLIHNTGRTAKNTEDVMIFYKGKPKFRKDAKKDKAEPEVSHYMFGAAGILPTEFNFQPPARKEKIHQSEKPVELIEMLLDFFTKENDVVVDQFAGSGIVGVACCKKKRNCILIEKSKEFCKKICNRFERTGLGLSLFSIHNVNALVSEAMVE